MKVFVFGGSLREGSLNKKLARCAAGLARARGAEVDEVDFRELEMPVYDGDAEKASGPPDGAHRMKQHFEAADAFIVAAPEYNGGMAGTLKNALDWTSRFRPFPMKGKHGLLLSASPGGFGGQRGLIQLRHTLSVLGVHVYPSTFSLPRAHQVFDDDGNLTDAQRRQSLEDLVGDFVTFLARD